MQPRFFVRRIDETTIRTTEPEGSIPVVDDQHYAIVDRRSDLPIAYTRSHSLARTLATYLNRRNAQRRGTS